MSARAMRFAVVALGALATVAAAAWLFDWNWLRGPVGTLVQERTGREFVIAGDLEVRLGAVPRVRMQAVRFGNPDWAQDPIFVTAREVELSVDLMSLLRGRTLIPELRLSQPEVSLERTADGRRNWVLPGDAHTPTPEVRQLSIDDGVIRYRDAVAPADLVFEVSTHDDDAEWPTTIVFSGRYREVTLAGSALAGPVLSLHDSDAAFPMRLEARFGDTVLEAEGSFGGLAQLASVDAHVKIRGGDWSRLYPVIPLPLPSSPPYRFEGRLRRSGSETAFENFSGRIGGSDLSGSAVHTQGSPRPRLRAELRSNLLDLKDLGPLIGARVRRPPGAQVAMVRDGGARVLPSDPFELGRLQAIDADVALQAQRIRRPDALPLDDFAARLRLDGGVLRLEPLDFGIAGGKLTAAVTLDARQDPMRTHATLWLRHARLAQLFPTVRLMQDSTGLVGARLRLAGRGNSVAAMLASASGDLGVAMAGGDVSNLLIEYAGLDGGEALRFLVGGDRKTAIRCAVGLFKVQDGVAMSRTLVFDTEDTNIGGAGRLDFRDETLDVTLRPQPKDRSILSVRSPLRLRGTFAQPSVAIERGPLAARAGAAVLLGLVNPLAALAATIETGPGTDSDCETLLASVEPVRRAAGARTAAAR